MHANCRFPAAEALRNDNSRLSHMVPLGFARDGLSELCFTKTGLSELCFIKTSRRAQQDFTKGATISSWEGHPLGRAPKDLGSASQDFGKGPTASQDFGKGTTRFWGRARLQSCRAHRPRTWALAPGVSFSGAGTVSQLHCHSVHYYSVHYCSAVVARPRLKFRTSGFEPRFVPTVRTS